MTTTMQRVATARRLFGTWARVTNPELLAALWNNLSATDRALWLDLADAGRTD